MLSNNKKYKHVLEGHERRFATSNHFDGFMDAILFPESERKFFKLHTVCASGYCHTYGTLYIENTGNQQFEYYFGNSKGQFFVTLTSPMILKKQGFGYSLTGRIEAQKCRIVFQFEMCRKRQTIKVKVCKSYDNWLFNWPKTEHCHFRARNCLKHA